MNHQSILIMELYHFANPQCGLQAVEMHVAGAVERVKHAAVQGGMLAEGNAELAAVDCMVQGAALTKSTLGR